MSEATLEVRNMADFDRRRNCPVDVSTSNAIAAVKLIKPGMAIARNVTTDKYELADGDVPFMLAETKGDRLDVLSSGGITALPMPSDEFLLDSFAYVGNPAAGAHLKIGTTTDKGKWTAVTIAAVADLKAAKLTVVEAADSNGQILVRPIS